MARVMTSGRVTTSEMQQWAIRSQVLGAEREDAVHRLNGGGFALEHA